jgi:hypothetical protein
MEIGNSLDVSATTGVVNNITKIDTNIFFIFNPHNLCLKLKHKL